MDDHDLMVTRANTVFTSDAQGRLLLSNEPCEAARRPAPRLFLGCTRAGAVVRFGVTVPDDLARQLAEVIARHLTAGVLRAPPAALTAVRETLARQAAVAAEGGGLAYRFPGAIAQPTGVVRLTLANRALARDTYPWLFDELVDWEPCFAVVHDGAAVSVCFSSRRGEIAAEAGVETLPDFRGRGYATAVTAAWSAAILASGRIPLYSTWWENVASQRVAERLGLIRFGTDTTWG